MTASNKAFAREVQKGARGMATALSVRGDRHRSAQPVWRISYYVGKIEDRIWKAINGGTKRGGRRRTAAILKAAKKLELRTRAKGRNGAR